MEVCFAQASDVGILIWSMITDNWTILAFYISD